MVVNMIDGNNLRSAQIGWGGVCSAECRACCTSRGGAWSSASDGPPTSGTMPLKSGLSSAALSQGLFLRLHGPSKSSSISKLGPSGEAYSGCFWERREKVFLQNPHISSGSSLLHLPSTISCGNYSLRDIIFWQISHTPVLPPPIVNCCLQKQDRNRVLPVEYYRRKQVLRCSNWRNLKRNRNREYEYRFITCKDKRKTEKGLGSGRDVRKATARTLKGWTDGWVAGW